MAELWEDLSIITDPVCQRLAVAVASTLATAESWKALLDPVLPQMLDSLNVRSVCLLQQQGPDWQMVATAGLPRRVPDDVVARASESQGLIASAGWIAIPLPPPQHLPPQPETLNLVLAVGDDLLVGASSSNPASSTLSYVARLISWAGTTMLIRLKRESRIKRLATMLDITSGWLRHNDTHQLLRDIASAAARMLNADRASIFLWDRPAKQLVGYPALGVEGEPLRISDREGIAGAVLKTGEPRRWDASDNPNEVNRSVDKSLGYITRSLVAVPLLDAAGKPMGVFELLNHINGRFSQGDQEALIELARPAAAAVENVKQIEQLVKTRDRLTRTAAEGAQIIGSCSAMANLKETVARVAATDLGALILGENGTGKEVVSRALHFQSKRRHEPFVAVNCAAIAESLLESELFGHEKGAFTDAHESRQGKFELASGGTLFLDEIGDMSLGGQAKLLRVLEEKVVVRVGGSKPIETDVRVLAATNQNLAQLVQAKKFREDLYYRLNVVILHLPSLRDRGEDVIELAEFFLDQFSQKIGRRTPTLEPSAAKRLLSHAWPGNVRELRNLMERLAYLTAGDRIYDLDLDFVLAPPSYETRSEMPTVAHRNHFDGDLAEATRLFQIDFIRQHVADCKNNMTETARRLGLHRSNLYRKMRQLGMDTPSED